MVALLSEQARHALRAHSVIASAQARTLAEIAKVQGVVIAGSLQLMGQANDRYFALIRSQRALLSLASTRR